jgi:hypothetical protein
MQQWFSKHFLVNPSSPVDQLDVAQGLIEECIEGSDVSVKYASVLDVPFHPLKCSIVSLLIVILTNTTGHSMQLTVYNVVKEIPTTMVGWCHTHIAHYSPVFPACILPIIKCLPNLENSALQYQQVIQVDQTAHTI